MPNCNATIGNDKIVCRPIHTYTWKKAFNGITAFTMENTGAFSSEMILPNNCIDFNDKQYYYLDKHGASTRSFAIASIFVLIIIMIINCKTWHPYRIDFYKAINYYILGTLAFGIFLGAMPGPGFQRPVAFGVRKLFSNPKPL